MITHVIVLRSDPAGIRTQDPYIKSVLLYQLSYRIDFFNNLAVVPVNCGAKVGGSSIRRKYSTKKKLQQKPNFTYISELRVKYFFIFFKSPSACVRI